MFVFNKKFLWFQGYSAGLGDIAPYFDVLDAPDSLVVLDMLNLLPSLVVCRVREGVNVFDCWSAYAGAGEQI